MFQDIGKVKRYNYDVYVDYEVRGRTSSLPWVKPKTYKVKVRLSHSAEYADFPLENPDDPHTMDFINYLKEHYGDPEYIADKHITSFTWYKEKPIFSKYGYYFDEDRIIIDSVKDIQLVNVTISVTSIKELHELSFDMIKKELTIDDFLQILDYGRDEIAKHKKNPTEQPHIAELPLF